MHTDSVQKVVGAKAIASAYANAVVLVTTNDGSGTGWVVGSRGLILTCAHVISDVGQPQVTLKVREGGAEVENPFPARVIRTDPARDLALLQVTGSAALEPLHLAGEDSIAMGEEVTVLAHPGLGSDVLTNTLTTGIVSHPDRRPMRVSYIQTTAAVNPGSSGAPMFNGDGAVIGVIAAKAARLE
jgi:S1-C subfamily serine protease